MRKTFRLLELILLAVMSVSLTACGNDDNEEETGKIVALTAANLTEDGYFDGLLYYQITSNNPKTAMVKKANSAIQVVEIPSRIKIDNDIYLILEIGENAFYKCQNLTSVTIPKSVISIGWCAFLGCTSLTSVNIADLSMWCSISINNYLGISTPLYYAHHLFLNGEEITELVIPSNVTRIGDGVFWGCNNLISVTIPSSVTSIDDNAFRDCSGLTFITIPNSVTTIGNSTFRGCSGLTSVSIGSSVTSIGDHAFYGCSSLTSVSIPNSVTSIGVLAFYGCSGLTSVTIPNCVTCIGEQAFSYCSGLTSVTIPNSVTSVGYHAFEGCSGLTSIHCQNSTPPDIDMFCSPFDSYVYQHATLYVPRGSRNAYELAQYWSYFSNIVEE